MRKTLLMLAASTALMNATGLPARSAPPGPAEESPRPLAALFDGAGQARPLLLASEDDEDHRGDQGASRSGGDEDEKEDEDDCDEDEDCRGGAPDPAPAGAIAPPRNGLFGNGAPPRVQVN